MPTSQLMMSCSILCASSTWVLLHHLRQGHWPRGGLSVIGGVRRKPGQTDGKRIVADADVRHKRIPDATDAEVASAMFGVYEIAIRESLREGGRWWGPPPTVNQYIAEHRPDL
jgi:hypothetical protein